MTLPNKLTLIRILVTPIFFIVFTQVYLKGLYPDIAILILLGIYVLNEITDALDGYYARKLNLVSDIGKLMDPFSDVFSRITYFICFYAVDLMPIWALMIILWREFFMGFLRTLLVREGTALGAQLAGKLKAICYFVMGIVAMFTLIIKEFLPNNNSLYEMAVSVTYVMAILSAVMAFLSFANYLKQFMKTKTWREFFHGEK